MRSYRAVRIHTCPRAYVHRLDVERTACYYGHDPVGASHHCLAYDMMPIRENTHGLRSSEQTPHGGTVLTDLYLTGRDGTGTGRTRTHRAARTFGVFIIRERKSSSDSYSYEYLVQIMYGRARGERGFQGPKSRFWAGHSSITIGWNAATTS